MKPLRTIEIPIPGLNPAIQFIHDSLNLVPEPVSPKQVEVVVQACERFDSDGIPFSGADLLVVCTPTDSGFSAGHYGELTEPAGNLRPGELLELTDDEREEAVRQATLREESK